MKVTRYTDYSLRALIYLSLNNERLVTISEIADCYGISRHHLVKVANKLAAHGYIGTVRGRQGGLRLTCEPERVSVGDVVRRMESGFEVINCHKPACPLLPACTLRRALHEAVEAFLCSLDRYTVADLVQNRDRLHGLIGHPGGDRRQRRPPASSMTPSP